MFVFVVVVVVVVVVVGVFIPLLFVVLFVRSDVSSSLCDALPTLVSGFEVRCVV